LNLARLEPSKVIVSFSKEDHSHIFSFVTLIQAGLLHFVLSKMQITEISDEEVVNLIGGDPSVALSLNGDAKQAALVELNDANDAILSEFRSMQASCVC
jgi:hypothetical protein